MDWNRSAVLMIQTRLVKSHTSVFDVFLHWSIHIKIYDMSATVIFKALEKFHWNFTVGANCGIYDISMIYPYIYIYPYVSIHVFNCSIHRWCMTRGHRRHQCHPSGRGLWKLNVELPWLLHLCHLSQGENSWDPKALYLTTPKKVVPKKPGNRGWGDVYRREESSPRGDDQLVKIEEPENHCCIECRESVGCIVI